MLIKILGSGCKMCMQLETNVKEAAKELGIDVTTEQVHDIREIEAHGVRTTPAMVINGKVRLAGKVPTPKDIKKHLK